MARFIVLLAALASVQSSAVNRVGGWGPPATTLPPPTLPPTTTPGWGVTDPPTTPGWSPPPPPPPSGWGPAPVNNVTIALEGELAAAGSGWAAENHAENIQVTGGWGVPADLLVSAGGDSLLAQHGSILQVTNVDDSEASSLNVVSVGQVAAADESLAVIASALDVAVEQNGWAGAAAEGISAADAETSILINA